MDLILVQSSSVMMTDKSMKKRANLYDFHDIFKFYGIYALHT